MILLTLALSGVNSFTWAQINNIVNNSACLWSFNWKLSHFPLSALDSMTKLWLRRSWRRPAREPTGRSPRPTSGAPSRKLSRAPGSSCVGQRTGTRGTTPPWTSPRAPPSGTGRGTAPALSTCRWPAASCRPDRQGLSDSYTPSRFIHTYSSNLSRLTPKKNTILYGLRLCL